MAETIREAYIRRSPKSAELYPRFKTLFPSGGGGHDGYVAAPFPVRVAFDYDAQLGTNPNSVSEDAHITAQCRNVDFAPGIGTLPIDDVCHDACLKS